MITTADVKLKETKDKKLTILTTDDNKPAEFNIKGKPAPMDGRMITTSNVDQFKKELEKDTKKVADKKKKLDQMAKKLAKEVTVKKKELKVPFSDPGRDE